MTSTRRDHSLGVFPSQQRSRSGKFLLINFRLPCLAADSTVISRLYFENPPAKPIEHRIYGRRLETARSCLAMRLINVETFKLEEFLDDQVPKYTILSHTWGADEEEVSFREL